jgi:hypothetical protein
VSSTPEQQLAEFAAATKKFADELAAIVNPSLGLVDRLICWFGYHRERAALWLFDGDYRRGVVPRVVPRRRHKAEDRDDGGPHGSAG